MATRKKSTRRKSTRRSTRKKYGKAATKSVAKPATWRHAGSTIQLENSGAAMCA